DRSPDPRTGVPPGASHVQEAVNRRGGRSELDALLVSHHLALRHPAGPRLSPLRQRSARRTGCRSRRAGSDDSAARRPMAAPLSPPRSAPLVELSSQLRHGGRGRQSQSVDHTPCLTRAGLVLRTRLIPIPLKGAGNYPNWLVEWHSPYQGRVPENGVVL